MNRLLGLIFISALLLMQAHAQQPYILVLGNAQDGGFPQAGCNKACCREVCRNPAARRYVCSVAIIDPSSRQSWVIDATPDFPEQLQLLRDHLNDSAHLPAGILLTHAHIGHYSGLMHMGREVMGTNGIPVYAMPRMIDFLKGNGPWSQLVRLQNIQLRPLVNNTRVQLNEQLAVTPVCVPHRDEYSETVGYSILMGKRRVFFLPDIDRLQRWDSSQGMQRIDSIFAAHDWVLLDGTFYSSAELGNGRMKEVPHPLVQETISLAKQMGFYQKTKLCFIHFNHTNPLLKQSPELKLVVDQGYYLAEQGMIIR